MSLTPVQPKSGKRHSRKAKKYYGENAWEALRLVRATWVLAVLTFFVAAFGAYQANVTTNALSEQSASNALQIQQMKRQARAAETQDSISKDMERRQLRAYVSAEYDQTLQADGYFRKVWFQNTGKTPAYHVQWSFNLKMKHPTHLHFDTSFTRVSNAGTLFPGQTIYVPVQHYNAIPNGTLQSGNAIDSSIRSRVYDVYEWGELRYSDAFDSTHYTRFRWHYYYTNIMWMVESESQGNEAN